MAITSPEWLPPPVSDRTFEYELLKGHFRTDGSFKNDAQLRSEYVHLTDELIRQMTEGVPVVDEKTGEFRTEKPDVVLWLDKSARPVSWLTKELWPVLAADAEGNIPKIPDFRYVNIDREQWVNMVDPNGVGYVDIDLVDPSIIRGLRSVFTRPEFKKDGLTPVLDSAPTELDGKVVLIVDEVRASGRTLAIAGKFLKRAFPDTEFASTHWMKGTARVRDARGSVITEGNADLPVRYKERDISGRGVGNREEQTSARSRSLTQRLGALFLSTRPVKQADPETGKTTIDPKSHQLRRELKQLANDVVAGEVLVLPSSQRGVDDAVERIERFNRMTFEEFRQARQRLLDDAR